jgi:two-component system, OmpR family, sensor histidine kinase ChvG
MSLRLKLLLLGLLTLALPWGGCRYARQMEGALREGEENSLQAVAQTIAASLQGRTDFLYREGQDAPQAAAVPGAAAGTSEAPTNATPSSATEAPPISEPAPTPYDLQPIMLSAAPYVNGYGDDWPRAPGSWRYFAKDRHRFGILTGVNERMLYVLLDVDGGHLIYDAPGSNPLDSAAIGDRVWIGIQDPAGNERQFFIAPNGPGSTPAKRIETGEYGQKLAVEEPRIIGAVQPSQGGYTVEFRVPLSMIGRRFGVLIDDRNARGAVPVSYGTLRSDDLQTVGRLIVSAPELTDYLAQFMQPGLRLAVTTASGRLLAQVDALAQVTELSRQRGILARFYRRFVDRPSDRSYIESEAPIYDRDHREVIGHLRATQTGDRWFNLRDRALTQMLNFTLITSAVAVTAMFAFAAWLALRLSRLRRASESALTREGLITTFPETQSPDELGDVARGFSTLLGRLNEYTSYLRTLAGKLAHEIRTPLTIVRSSLENLETETQVPASARVYLERARQGSERLNTILIAMGAATRVEEAISNAERSRFDLVPVVASAAGAYRAAFPERRFASELPSEPLMIDGAPDLIVQALDKLIDNAVDFSPTGATITIRVIAESHAAVLEVDNAGPPIAPEILGRLFESLWQSRRGGAENDSRPHFGLGLYIVRLIAEFHGGSATAENLPAVTEAQRRESREAPEVRRGAAGARFTVRLQRQ